MILTVWLALGVLATLMTVTFLIVLPQERVVMTAGSAGLCWSVMALTARNLEIVTDSGSRVAVDLVSMQFLAAFFAVISWLALGLYHFGRYPPAPKRSETTA